MQAQQPNLFCCLYVCNCLTVVCRPCFCWIPVVPADPAFAGIHLVADVLAVDTAVAGFPMYSSVPSYGVKKLKNITKLLKGRTTCE
jgi:hypothetical protein